MPYCPLLRQTGQLRCGRRDRLGSGLGCKSSWSEHPCAYAAPPLCGSPLNIGNARPTVVNLLGTVHARASIEIPWFFSRCTMRRAPPAAVTICAFWLLVPLGQRREKIIFPVRQP